MSVIAASLAPARRSLRRRTPSASWWSTTPSSCAAWCRAGSTRSRASRSSPRCAPAARRSSSSTAPIPTSSCSTSRCPTRRHLDALPLLLEKKRDLVVIMASTLTRRERRGELKALSLGAADYIPKPATEARASRPRRRSGAS